MIFDEKKKISSGQSVTWEDCFFFNLRKSQHWFWPPQATSPAEQPHPHHCTETHHFTESILKNSRAKKHTHTLHHRRLINVSTERICITIVFSMNVFTGCASTDDKSHFLRNHWIALLNYFSPQIYIDPHSPPTRPHSNPLSPPLMFLSQPQSTVVR